MFNKVILIWGILGVSLASFAQDYVPGEVIVRFKDEVNSNQPAFASKALGLVMNKTKSWSVINTHKFQMKPGQTMSVEQMVSSLKADPNVAYAEPNYIYEKKNLGIEGESVSLSSVVSERSQGLQGKVGAFSSDYFQSSAPIQVEEAWSTLDPSPTFEPVVAVIDTGVDYSHEVFTGSNAIWTNPGEIPGNNIDDDGNGYIDDVRGWNFVEDSNDPMDDENHGTHVAGIILGITQDIFASPLDNARIKIMPLKFLDGNGAGATSDAIEAVTYAINNGATVINASWGGGGFSNSLLDVIVDAHNAKIGFVAAAGNSSLNNDQTPTYPANYAVPNVISIAASSDSDILAGFSNFGATTVHISSPGVSILSTLPGDSYGYSSGTSMAAPISAGIIALMQSEEGKAINGFQANQILMSENDTNVGNLNNKVFTDSRVNVFKSISHVQNASVPDDNPSVSEATLRGLASTGAEGAAGGGCGMVRTLANGAQGGSPLARGALFLMLLAPLVVLISRRRERHVEGVNRRVHDRFDISSSVSINVGSKKLTGQVSCISMGGVKINTEALLESGGIIEMNIMSPDGKEKIQAVGKVVWSSEEKSYGVKFCDIAESQSNAISNWTNKLVKSTD